MKLINESALLIEIEEFILNVVDYVRQPRNFYCKLAHLLMDFKTIYNDDFAYFGVLQAFIALMYEMGDDMGFSQNTTLRIEYTNLEDQLRNIGFNEIQRDFKSYVRKHKSHIHSHRFSEKQNRNRLDERMREISQKYARILVVRVDLAYLNGQQHLINIEDFYQDINKLRDFIGNKDKSFQGLVEYAWALEQGESKGYHCHLLLVYKGYEHQNAYGIAKAVGELWQEITRDTGYYFNCHDPSYLEQYENKGCVGIGMIYRSDTQQIENMLNTVSYLVRPEKEDQHLRVKASKRMRTFG